MTDPLIDRWLALPTNADLDAAWMARAYQSMLARELGSQGNSDHYNLNEAATFLVKRSIQELLFTYPLPTHVVSPNAMPYDDMFIAFQYQIPLAHQSLGLEVGMTFLYLQKKFDGIRVIRDAVKDETLQREIYEFFIPFASYTPDAKEDGTLPLDSLVLSFLAFIKSPFVNTEREKLPRQFRRHDLANHPLRDSEISVVTLRASSTETENTNEHGAFSLNHTHRWWVRGHMRAQWHPSTQDHSVIWIAPHIKGPAGAPIVPRVYHVTR